MVPAETPSEKREVKWDTGDYYDASFAVKKSRRYHERLSSFYSGMSAIVSVANMILGSTAFITLAGGKSTIVAQICSVLVVSLSGAEKFYKLNAKSQTHEALKKQFIDLDIKLVKLSPTPKNLETVVSRRLEIEKGDFPVKRLVDLMAANDVMGELGYPHEDLVPLGWWQERLGYFFTFGMKRLERWREKKRVEDRIAVG
ncbi:hypothetical protein [Xanthobacter flavus]|uniref:hypothetical protein n=1 Tax=Xanthobacter flavus TaxID=281 RepID=UPI00372AB9FB